MINDKVLHFGAGFLIALIVSFTLNPIAGFVAAAVIGFVKEVYDYLGNGTPDLMDFIATVFGGAVGGAICFVAAYV